MKKFVTNLFVMLLVVQTAALFSQTREKPAPVFKLALAEGNRDATMVSWQTRLVVRLTNISTDLIREDGCSALSAMYKLSVVYNGVPLDEPAEAKSGREAREAGKCLFASARARVLQPGQYWDDELFYNTTKPGTYEFTVEEKTFPQDPQKSVTVKSNTVTVVVTDSDAAVPK